MKGITKRQRELVDYIEKFITNHRYSPSYREIGKHFGFLSIGSVYKHIQALKRKGLLDTTFKSSRSILLNETNTQTSSSEEISISFIGIISRGMPIKLFPKPQELFVPKSLVQLPERTYALKMQGDFLAEEMIADGDILLVEVREYAYSGETVLALVNGKDTLIKKYYLNEEQVRLHSIYTNHNPLIISKEDIVIQGVIVGLLRFYS